MKNTITKVVLAVLTVGLLHAWLGLCAVVHAQGVAPETRYPEESFEHLWKSFDDKYALFDAKGVDWNALYRVYRPKVSEGTTDDELFQILSDLLGHLNDNHVTLSSKNPDRFFSAGYLWQLFSGAGGSADAYKAFQKMMAERPVPESYFVSGLQEKAGGIFAYGWAGDSLGYLHFNRFANLDASREAIDEIVNAFRDAQAIIIDVRRNMGGDDRIGKVIADRFSDRKRLYMTTRGRDGPNHDDFANPKEWYVEPDGPAQFTKTILLLTDRTSVSAAENFALAMKVLPHVVQIGDLTSGCFADSAGDELPNDWSFSYSYNLFTDHRGFCWEGIGIPPEIRQVNTEADIRQGRDRVFEVAVAIVASGDLEPEQVRIAHWRLDEAEGVVAFDSAGTADGVLVGDPLWQPAGGTLKGALLLDGVDDYVSTTFVLDPADGPFSVFAWIQGGVPADAVISQTDGIGGSGETWLGTEPASGKFMSGLVPPPAGRFIPQPLKSVSIITDGQWHHIGFVWDGSYRSLYVDGVEVAKDATAQDPLESGTGGLYIGAGKALDTTSFFSGLIDDVRIYTVALSADKISALAQ